MVKRGEILAFTSEQGFGRVAIDGAPMTFDVMAVRGPLPVVGQTVEVLLATAADRQRVVELRTPSLPKKELLSPAKGLAMLHEHGVARGLTKLARNETLTEALKAYYRRPSRRAVADGFVRLPIDEADTAVAKLAKVVGGATLVVQTRIDEDAERLSVKTARGRTRRFDFTEKHSLADLAAAFDAELAHREDPRRFFSIASGDTTFVFLLLPVAVARDLAAARALPFEPHPALAT